MLSLQAALIPGEAGCAQCEGFCNVRPSDFRCFAEIGNGAGDAQAAMPAARRQAQAVGRAHEQIEACRVGRAVALRRCGSEIGIGAALARERASACGLGEVRGVAEVRIARCACEGRAERGRIHGRYVHTYIDTVEEWPRQA